MTDIEMELPECPDCRRLHYQEAACPRRMARALTNPVNEHLWEVLTEADVTGVAAFIGAGHKVEDILEEWLAESEDSVIP